MDGITHNMALHISQSHADSEAFDALVKRRGRLVFQVAYAAVGRAHDAEDVVQEVFLRLFRTGAWRRMEDEAAFLARTTWRLARTRNAMSSAPLRGDADAGESLLDVPDASPTPEQQAMRQQKERLLRRLIDQLPPDLRFPLVLSAIEELPSSAVAEILGIPAGTVRTRVLRARQLLREKYRALTGEKS